MPTPVYAIGIAGGTGAGKTAVAREVADTIGEHLTHIPLDNYYEDQSEMTLSERQKQNYDHPSAFAWPLIRDHLGTLLAGESIEMPQYDFERHTRTAETVPVEPTGVIVLEGIFALYDEQIRNQLDLCVYVQTDADVRICRRIQRDVVDRGRDLEGVVDQYLSTVKPMHEQFVEPTKRHADVIIPEGVNRNAVDLLTEKLDAELARA